MAWKQALWQPKQSVAMSVFYTYLMFYNNSLLYYEF